MSDTGKHGGETAAGRPRRVRMTRQTGQALVLSNLCCCREDGSEAGQIEVRVSQVCAGGTAILEVILPDGVFVERKETLEGVRALFPRRTLGASSA